MARVTKVCRARRVTQVRWGWKVRRVIQVYQGHRDHQVCKVVRATQVPQGEMVAKVTRVCKVQRETQVRRE